MTTNNHPTVELTNLDAIGRDELLNIWTAVHRSPVTVARLWFPSRPLGYTAAARLLGAYASNKATAMYCRERGDIIQASNYETICDGIYSRLPDYARVW